MVVYLNGKFVDGEKAAVSIWDGGYLFGDGIFTTLRLYQGKAIDAAAHHQRLRRQAHLLDLPFTLSEEMMTSALHELVIANGLQHVDSRARITLSRGGHIEAPLPLENLDQVEPTIVITTGPLPRSLSQWTTDGISAISLGHAFSRGNLPHIKTLNALPTLMALRKAHKAGCPEALVFGQEGQLLEGIVSNVFLVVQGNLVTPLADGNLLPGRTRERVISCAAHLDMELEEKVISRAQLDSVNEIFLTNSVREIVPVVMLDGKPVGSGLPGPITRRLQDQYHSDINAGLYR